jgi:hypothetical protein
MGTKVRMLDCREVVLEAKLAPLLYRLFSETLQMDQRLANRNSGFTTFAGLIAFYL